MKNEYTITVVFERFHSEDDEMVEQAYGEVNAENLKRQLIKELQCSADHGFLAGNFTVLSADFDKPTDEFSTRETD